MPTATFDINDPRQVAQAARDFVAASTSDDPDRIDMTEGEWMEYPLPTDGAPRLVAWDQSTFGRFLRVEEIPLDLGPTAGEECGTACCVAGYVKILDATAGNRMVGFSVSHIARERLGLDVYQADTLFVGNNTAEEVLAMLDELIACPDAVARRELEFGLVKEQVANGEWVRPSEREVVIAPSPEFL